VRGGRRCLCAASAGLATLALTGCATTQVRNERAQLAATRELASRRPVVVVRPDADVLVRGVTPLRGSRGTAVVVELRNTLAHPLTDLPISVGIVRDGRRSYLNRHAGLSYFQTHVAAIGAHADLRWVFVARRRAAGGGRAFAVVGAPATPPVSHATVLPRISVSAVAAVAAVGGSRHTLRVHVHNASGIPQLGLVIYALARRDGRLAAAGRTEIAHLGTGADAIVEIGLVGGTAGASVTLQAPPTIFA
jgi:hypothetical protein